MGWDQCLILLTGPAAIGLSQIPRTERWACLVGLVGQVGWFHATWAAAQWGMFAASFVYAGMWCIGLRRHWLGNWSLPALWNSGTKATATTPSANALTGPGSRKGGGGASNKLHPPHKHSQIGQKCEP